MDVNIYYTEVYENKSNWTLGENKPNQTQFKSEDRGQRSDVCLRSSVPECLK